jgi:hypothetical protein
MKICIRASIMILSTAMMAVIASHRVAAQPITNTDPIPPYQRSAYQIIGRDVAARSAIEIQVAPGRATTIDFNQTDEVITYVLLADPSRVVYTTNADLESGQAKTLLLRTIQPLDFPGATRTDITNLTVQTLDSTGQQRLYTFNLVPISSTPRYTGVSVAMDVAGHQTLILNDNRIATLNDIEQGLGIAIRRGYTRNDDSIVLDIRQLLALARNNSITIQQAATDANVPLSVLTELAEMALEERVLESIGHPTTAP